MSPLAIGQESPENRGPYYEDDAWYDVSEWFDGNDYNPTGEVWWRWDNESYQAASDTGRDFDNDLYDRDFNAGYDDDERYYDDLDSTDSTAAKSTSDSDWLYAYHDLGYTSYVDWDDDGSFDTRYAYYDFNDDDYYDAYFVSSDNDGDGVYETNRYYSFNDLGQQHRGQQNEATQAARRVTRSGEIRQIRRTEVNDRVRYLAKVHGDNDRMYWFDLGSADAVEPTALRIGDRISATGALTKVGDNLLLIASRYTMDGRATKARRAMRVVNGEIANTKQVQVGDRQVLLAIVKNEDDTQMAVDLGSANGVPWRLEAGDRLSATGAPIKVGDKRLLLAHFVQSDGRTALIDRRQERSKNRQQREPSDQERSKTGAQEEEQSVDTWQRGVRSSSSTAAIGQAEVEGSIASLRTAMAGGLRHRLAQLQPVGSSRVDLQACKLEYSIVSPK